MFKHFLRATMLVAYLGGLLMAPVALGGGFDRELFESWLDMRVGGGKSDVYWYSEGTFRDFPGGEVTAKMIGFDAGKLLRDPQNPDRVQHLSRKIFYFFDPETGARLARAPIAYPHQLKTYELVGDEIVYTVESNNGRSVYTLGPMENYTAKRIGDVHWFNYSVFIQRGSGKFENSDFFVQPDKGQPDQQRFQHAWTSYGVGPIMSSAVAWRYSSFDEMPKAITEIVRSEAPMWMLAPQDLKEIDRMRQATLAKPK
ncbi:MAG: hypothetical protein AAF358_11895 [Pseudomonadota bacterium]